MGGGRDGMKEVQRKGLREVGRERRTYGRTKTGMREGRKDVRTGKGEGGREGGGGTEGGRQ